MDTRQHDLNYLRKAWSNAKDHERRIIEKAGDKIRKESRAIKEMRQRLVMEHRQGNVENIKDIHDYIRDKQRYQNG